MHAEGAEHAGGQVAEETTPAFRVVRGTPTAEELAALVGVLFSRRAAEPAEPPRPVSRWRASALPNIPLRPGTGAWQASALPSR